MLPLIPDCPRCRSSFAVQLLAAMLGCAAALTGAARAAGAQVPLDQFIRELEQSYHQVRSLKAQFTQTYQWGARSRTESGSVIFARGGRMRWDYRQPEKRLFLSDGKQVVLYVPAEKQATVSSLKASEDYRVPFRLLLSRVDLRKVFEKIEDAPDALPAQEGQRVLRAIPKHGDRTGVHEVLMAVDPNFDIRRLVVVYTDLSRMEFTFTDIERNVGSTPALFHFNAPKGTQVIVQH